MLAFSYKLVGFPCGFKEQKSVTGMTHTGGHSYRKIADRDSCFGRRSSPPPVSKMKIKLPH